MELVYFILRVFIKFIYLCVYIKYQLNILVKNFEKFLVHYYYILFILYTLSLLKKCKKIKLLKPLLFIK